MQCLHVHTCEVSVFDVDVIFWNVYMHLVEFTYLNSMFPWQLLQVLAIGICLAQNRTDTEPKDQYGKIYSCIIAYLLSVIWTPGW